MMSRSRTTIASAAADLASGRITAVSLLADCTRHLESARPLNAYITETAEDAAAAAAASDQRRAIGQTLGPLDGIPLAVKDNFCTAGVRTTAGSVMLKEHRPIYDATLVARWRAAGAVLMGKTNMDEFGMGSFNAHSAAGPCYSPWRARDSESACGELAASCSSARVAGGSSGGSAVAVACGSALGALGSDTGGSVRLPAAYNGLVGFRPSYGRLSRWGLVAYASSMDVPGVFAHSVADCRTLFDALDGPDALDSTCCVPPPLTPAPSVLPQAGSSTSLRGLRVGVPSEAAVAELSAAVSESWAMTAQQLTRLGAEVVPVRLPHTAPALAAYYILVSAEASSNLARYDGVRYGERRAAQAGDADEAEAAASLHEAYARSRSAAFGQEVQRRLLMGTYALSSELVSVSFQKAQQVRQLVIDDFARAFQQVDMLLTPVAPDVAPLHTQASQMPVTEAYAMDVMTVPAGLAGLPGLSVPVAVDAAHGLPLGLQLLGPRFSERQLLAVGEVLEAAVLDTAEGQTTASVRTRLHSLLA